MFAFIHELPVSAAFSLGFACNGAAIYIEVDTRTFPLAI